MLTSFRCACRWQDEADPLAFKPERWAGQKDGAWIPFGGGARLCVGYALAMVEMKVGGLRRPRLARPPPLLLPPLHAAVLLGQPRRSSWQPSSGATP